MSEWQDVGTEREPDIAYWLMVSILANSSYWLAEVLSCSAGQPHWCFTTRPQATLLAEGNYVITFYRHVFCFVFAVFCRVTTRVRMKTRPGWHNAQALGSADQGTVKLKWAPML